MASNVQEEKVLKDDRKRSVVSADFKVGDQILCYEPDTTKAKMLYEAKVLETDVTKDDKGRKVPEYFIHFIGWNKSWDRWVLGESVLEDCDTNRQLQKTLYEKAIGKKKKLKFQKQKPDTDIDSIETVSQSNQSTANSSHAEGDQSHDLPVVSINIPNVLKNKLEDDCYYIKRKKKLLKLPRTPSAVEILRDYLKHCEMSMSSDNQGLTPSGKSFNIDVVREVMEGLLTYLNFTLSTLLLYNFEKEQYHALFSNERILERGSEWKREAKVGVCTPPQGKISEAKVFPGKRKLSRRKQVQENKEAVLENKSNQLSEIMAPSVSGSCGVEVTQPTRKKRGRPYGTRKIGATLPNSQRPISRRETRATAQTVAQRNEMLPSFEIKDSEEQTTKRIRQEPTETTMGVEVGKSEIEHLQTIGICNNGNDNVKEECNVEEETTGKSKESITLEKDTGSFIRSLRPRRPISVQNTVGLSSNDYIPEQFTLPVGASACSMEKSNLNAIRMKDQQRHGSDSKESSFVSIPAETGTSKSPAEIYGVEHLLRLFVKLPSILSRSELDSRKRLLLIEYLEMFLRYLAERANGLFDKRHYSEPVI